MAQPVSARGKARLFSPKWRRVFKRRLPLHIMLLPCVILVLIFSYGPMVGIIVAFQKYNPRMGMFASPLVGLKNFIDLLELPDTTQVLFNTVFIAFMKIIGGLIVPIFYALLLNEVRVSPVKRTVQTIIYMPNFLSWIILSGILIDILSPSEGIVNQIIQALGGSPVFFLGNEKAFPFVLVVTDVWKSFGFGTIIYLAAITSIDPTLYEAAIVDGASKLRQTWHITLPGMVSIIVLMATLSLGNVLNAGFEQVLMLYSPIVYKTGDILDTFVFRLGLEQGRYGVASAVGLFKSVVSFLFIAVSYLLAYRYASYRVF
jgi:putative aldouronate transport system permease protein